jgi:hypothetical protein
MKWFNDFTWWVLGLFIKKAYGNGFKGVECGSCYAMLDITPMPDNCPFCEAKLPSEATDAK